MQSFVVLFKRYTVALLNILHKTAIAEECRLRKTYSQELSFKINCMLHSLFCSAIEHFMTKITLG